MTCREMGASKVMSDHDNTKLTTESPPMSDTIKEASKNPTVALAVAVVIFTLIQMGVIGPAAAAKEMALEKRLDSMEYRLEEIQKTLASQSNDGITRAEFAIWGAEASKALGTSLPSLKRY